MSDNNSLQLVTTIKSTVAILKEFMRDPEVIKLRETNYEEYESLMKSTVPTFYSLYPCLLDLIIRNEDLSNLDIILNNMIKADKLKLVGTEKNDFIAEKSVKMFK